MKIWTKILIFVLATSIILIEVVFYQIKDIYEDEQIRLHGEQLKTISSISALSLPSEKLESLYISFSDTLPTLPSVELDEKLLEIKKSLGLKQDIYSLYLVDSNIAIYGPNTNTSIPAGDTLIIVSPIRQRILWDVYNEKASLHTPIYKNNSGTWIAGMAPVISPEGKVIAIVTTAFDPDSVNVAISSFNDDLIITRLILFPILILLSILISRQISRPLSRVTDFMESFSFFGKEKKLDISAEGEVKRLIDAANSMHSKILNQQSKIRRIISDLRKAQRKAQALAKIETTFLRIISHELRTPLHGMSISALLKDDIEAAVFKDEDEKAQIMEYVDMVDESYKRLKEFVELVLEYIEYQSLSVHLKLSKVKYGDFISKAVNEFKLERSDIKIYHLGKFENDHEIVLDTEKCGNSIKTLIDIIATFSKEKNVVIKERVIDDKDYLVEFKSKGEGTFTLDIKNIWEPFKESNVLRRGEVPGLKLAIIKLIIEKQGGEISVAQDIDSKGISFIIKFKILNAKKYDQVPI
ncbi:MAG: HAMP domain-containing histidine kinase [Ignavibacteriae bacterium]|nr:HAMP domain-containing histidine kinase [Ignavibacteriota bacterium]